MPVSPIPNWARVPTGSIFFLVVPDPVPLVSGRRSTAVVERLLSQAPAEKMALRVERGEPDDFAEFSQAIDGKLIDLLESEGLKAGGIGGPRPIALRAVSSLGAPRSL